MCSDEANAPADAKRVQILDRDWFTATLDGEPEAPLRAHPIGPETPIRIVRGSGTTGSTKWMIHTGRIREFRINQYAFHAGFNQASRFLMTLNFGMQSFYAYLTACLRMGGVCINDPENDTAGALAKHAVTHVTMLPHMLNSVLDGLPDGYDKPENLIIFTNGASISKPVRDRVKQSLANDLVDCYGTNEIGPVSITGEDGVGTVLPGVRIQTVDDNDEPVIGTPGRLRIMSEGSVGGYQDDPEATRAMFRDGWFYPGDLATIRDERRFELIGRADDLLNIRGIKISPQKIEEKLLRELPVTDICLTALADDSGMEQIWVVVEPDEKALVSAIQKMLVP